MQTEIPHPLADMDDWRDFAAQNADELVARYGSIAAAFRHLIDGGLTIGGGAAPLFHVFFEEG